MDQTNALPNWESMIGLPGNGSGIADRLATSFGFSPATRTLPNGGGTYSAPTSSMNNNTPPPAQNNVPPAPVDSAASPSFFHPPEALPPAQGDAKWSPNPYGNSSTGTFDKNGHGIPDSTDGSSDYSDYNPSASDVAHTVNTIGGLYAGSNPNDLWSKREALQTQRSLILGGLAPGEAENAAKLKGVPLTFDDILQLRKADTGGFDEQIGSIDKAIADQTANAKAGGAGATSDEIQSWADNITNGKATLAQVPSAVRNAVSLALSKGGAGPAQQNSILQETSNSLDDLQKMIDTNQGFTSAVGAKGAFSGGLFGLAGPRDTEGGVAGSGRANFDAKMNKVVNGVVLPNLTLLHGLGRITDREFQTLKSGLTDLSTNQSEGEFKKSLTELNTFVKSKLNTGSPSSLPAGKNAPISNGVDLSKFAH